MHLSAPKRVVFIIAVVLAALSLVSAEVTRIPLIAGNEFWFLMSGFVVLVLGTLIRDF